MQISTTSPLFCRNMAVVTFENDDKYNDFTNKDILEDLLPFLSQKRRDKEHYWLDVGRAIYNTYRGDQEGLDIWIEFTKGSHKFTKDDCLLNYRDFGKENFLTVKTIAFYAKTDNVDRYDKWVYNIQKRYVMKHINSNSYYTLAHAGYYIHWLDYVYYPQSRSYIPLDIDCQTQTVNGVVTNCDRHTFLNIHMISLKVLLGDIIKEMEENGIFGFQMKEIKLLLIQLEKAAFRGGIISGLSELLTDGNIYEKIGSNPNLMGMANGVLETTSNRMIFREQKPEDYINMRSKIEFDSTLMWQDEKVEEFMEWMRKLQPDDQKCEVLLRLLASLLQGKRSDSKDGSHHDEIHLAFFKGTSGNGITTLIQLMKIIWGPHFVHYKSNYLDNLHHADRLYSARNYRIICIGDVDTFDNTNRDRVAVIKELICGDMINPTHGNPFRYMPKLLFNSSEVPELFEQDGSIKRKMKVVEFETTFRSNIQEDDNLEFEHVLRANPTFDEKLESLAPAALWVLVQKFNVYQSNGFDLMYIKSSMKK